MKGFFLASTIKLQLDNFTWAALRNRITEPALVNLKFLTCTVVKTLYAGVFKSIDKVND